MKRSPPLTRRPAWALLAPALAPLLILLLLGQGLERHPVWESHAGVETLQGSVTFPSASHPQRAHHVEASSAGVEHPPCAACLHNLLTAGAHLAPSPYVLPDPPAERLSASPVAALLAAARCSCGARAPPAAV